MIYTTKEIAEICGVHPNTVRLYEKWGFISEAKRKENQYRIFNEAHLTQMRLARLALPGPYPLDGKIVQNMVKEFAKKNLSSALFLAREYLERVESEKVRANQALVILDQWFVHKTGDKNRIVIVGRNTAAQELQISMDALRTWERNNLFTIQKDNRGRLAFSEWDIEKIKVIRLLRNCGYSINSLHKVFNLSEHLLEKPSILLSLPDLDTEFFYVTDLYLDYLEQHHIRAQKIINFIECYAKQTELSPW